MILQLTPLLTINVHLTYNAHVWDVIIICHTYQLKMAKNKKWPSHGRNSQTVGAALVFIQLLLKYHSQHRFK